MLHPKAELGRGRGSELGGPGCGSWLRTASPLRAEFLLCDMGAVVPGDSSCATLPLFRLSLLTEGSLVSPRSFVRAPGCES